MSKFKDNAGRDWDVNITVGTVKRVKADTSYDLITVIGGEVAIQRLSTDPLLLAEVLFSIIRPQAEAKGITLEQFLESLGGESIEKATDAFMEALANFSPPQRRDLLLKAVGKLKEAEKVILAEANKTMDDPKFAEKLLASVSGGNSTGTPPS